ncbi:hypothetical protein Daud_1565 [Candidatus Desulforudis audaxviator MP104C]|uniref:WD40 domain protein beta Propeller n=2 Tax=Candidatus Desulforudis TaxID=471826 RepID=B1I538_DESAP|nr:hypothetical protein Daud_1565 [Candidatus Desulforudis audaxviator MP104C]AZK60105.1 hypothetical protein Daudx_1559 [Candidatus Desulforudis audaxviator]
MLRRFWFKILILLLFTAFAAAGCGGVPPAVPELGPAPPEAGGVAPVRVPEQQQGLAGDFTVLRLPGLPPHFELAGWLDTETLVGRSGDRVTVFRQYTGETFTLGGTAWNVWPAPDGSRVAYNNEQGIWVADTKTGADTLVVARDPQRETAPGGVIWAPDSTRFLFTYEHEWDSEFFVVEPGGEPSRLDTEMENYFLKAAVAWPVADRVLFTVRASAKKDGTREYGSGYRSDFAVYDISDGSFERITDLNDGCFITFEGSAAEGRFAYLIRDEQQRPLETGLMDTEGRGVNRRGVNPAVSGLLTSAVGGSVYYLRPVEHVGPGDLMRILVEQDGRLVPVVDITYDYPLRFHRSPDGRQLGFTFGAPVPVEGGYTAATFGYLIVECKR